MCASLATRSTIEALHNEFIAKKDEIIRHEIFDKLDGNEKQIRNDMLRVFSNLQTKSQQCCQEEKEVIADAEQSGMNDTL